ncbi:MAG: hypothetical protein ABGY71_14200 [bacterium]|jgi:hypothetical protein|nr:hypothetical protein [Planctomycetota bacterium]
MSWVTALAGWRRPFETPILEPHARVFLDLGVRGRGKSELGTSEFLSAKIVLADPKDSKTVVITAKLVGAI